MYSGSGHTNSLLDNFYNPKGQKFLLENFVLSMRYFVNTLSLVLKNSVQWKTIHRNFLTEKNDKRPNASDNVVNLQLNPCKIN